MGAWHRLPHLPRLLRRPWRPARSATRTYEIFRITALADRFDVARLPYSIKVILENLLRHEDGVGRHGRRHRGRRRLGRQPRAPRRRRRGRRRDRPHPRAGADAGLHRRARRGRPGRHARRPARAGRRPGQGQPAGAGRAGRRPLGHRRGLGHAPAAYDENVDIEYQRNIERYQLLRWAQQAFDGFRVVPPGMGICHQVNLEYLSRVVFATDDGRAYCDTLVGTDSHTTMVNGLGVLGWGVGGIEAEAAMLGQPLSMLLPPVVGFRLTGEQPAGTTATDLVLTITNVLRKHGVVGKFVEFFGPGVASVPLANRATIGNMSPEYGATCAMFPIDEVTLDYLRFSGRDDAPRRPGRGLRQGPGHVPRRPTAPSRSSPRSSSSTCPPWCPSIAGPSRPQDLVPPRRRPPTPFRAALGPRRRRATPPCSAAGADRGDRATATSWWPPSPPAPTPRTPRSWWRPACWPATPWPAA